jgi:hypothetical protein
MVIASLRHPPYRLGLLFDLPDTMAVFELGESVPPEVLGAFVHCVGDAKPVHYQEEAFSAFYNDPGFLEEIRKH